MRTADDPMLPGLALLLAAFSLAISLDVSAQFARGDVALALAPGDLAVPYSGSVRILRPATSTFTTLARLERYSAHAIAFDSAGRLAFSFNTTVHGPLATEVWTSTTDRAAAFPFGGWALAYDSAGNLYATTSFAGNEIRKYSSAGVLLGSFILPAGAIVGIDLAADQCTLFAVYASRTSPIIARHDVCTNTPLPPVPLAAATFTGDVTGLRILPDGSLLVSAGTGAVRLTQSGTVQRRYATDTDSDWIGVALDETGQTFWAASMDELYRIDLSTGAIVAGPFPIIGSGVRSIAVAGERRAALAGAAAVPALSPVALLLLASTVAAIALHRLG